MNERAHWFKKWLSVTDMCDGLGHISWGTNEAKGTIGRNMTTFGLRTMCMLSNGYGNPILQYLRGKSRLLFVYEFLKWLTNNIALLKKYCVINETLLKNCWVINEKCMIYNKVIPNGMGTNVANSRLRLGTNVAYYKWTITIGTIWVF